MPSLSRLLLKGNPNIKSPPHHLVEGKSVEAINYLKASASRRFVKDDFMRLVLIGDSGHGKSSLLSHLMFDSLEKSRSARGPLAVDWWDMKVPQQDGQPQSTIKFETWDLSCPAQALDLLRPMLSVRTTYLVVTRVNDTKNIPKWLNLINSKVSDPEILIVATHLDTYVNAADDVRKLQALYHDSARDVVGVSSAKKSINIPQLRTAIANSCIKNRYWSTIFVPQKWLALEENLAMEDESFLYLLNFEVLLSKCDIKKASQMIRAYRFLKERGRIIGPETAPTGQDVLVLHAVPLWSALTKLATTGKSQFTNAELDRVIGATDRQKLILLLKQLFLAVDRPDGSLLIPALISEEARVKSLEKANIKVMEYSANATLRQTFKFGTEAHTGIIREFALRMHNKAVVSDYDGSDYFAVHQTEKASAFVVREDSFTIHVYILKGAKGEDKDAISDLTNLMAEQLEHTFFAWKTYPIDYSYVESPVGHDGSYRPTSTRRGSGPKRVR
jgi:GTPase SAR1 family protein